MKKEKVEIIKYSCKKNQDEYFVYIIPNNENTEDSIKVYIQKNERGVMYLLQEAKGKCKDDVEKSVEEIVLENIENTYNSIAGYKI